MRNLIATLTLALLVSTFAFANLKTGTPDNNPPKAKEADQVENYGSQTGATDAKTLQEPGSRESQTYMKKSAKEKTKDEDAEVTPKSE